MCAGLRTAALALLTILGTATATDVQDCEVGSRPLSVDILDCDVPPCRFYRGESMSGNITFVTEAATATLRPDVQATLSGITINYPLPQQDACQSLISGSCPLAAGATAVYSLVLDILEMYPRVNLTVQLSLVDAADSVVACFRVDGEVTDRPARTLRRFRPLPLRLP